MSLGQRRPPKSRSQGRKQKGPRHHQRPLRQERRLKGSRGPGPHLRKLEGNQRGHQDNQFQEQGQDRLYFRRRRRRRQSRSRLPRLRGT